MSTDAGEWGSEIAIETVNGVPYRMYSRRPRRVGQVLALADRWSERPYVIQRDRALSFGQLQQCVRAKSATLSASGATAGRKIVIMGWNSPEWVVNFWACLSIGAVPVLANAWWSAPEVKAALELIDPALILADPHATGKLPPRCVCGPWEIGDTASPAASAEAAETRSEEDTALIIFTSGTSGLAKAVALSHRAVLARLQMTLHVTRKLPHQIDGSGHDVTLITGPLFHVGQMQSLLRAAIVGDTLVMPGGRFDPAEILELIEKHRVNRWPAVPTMVSRLLDHPDVARRSLSSLKSISVGGAPVHGELMRRIRLNLPSVSPRVPTGYGLTENGGQATAAAGSDKPELLGSAGRPLPCVEVRFLAHDGLPDGEILLRSPTQMQGYVGLAETPIDAEGWLHTGDLGRMDDQGCLWITGRRKDMIIRGGENIAPAAIEQALMGVPGVIEAAVFGVPHADLGEEVAAVVVADAELTPDHLRSGLKDRVSSFAIPTKWRVQRDPLPTNQTGKIDKVALGAQATFALAGE